MTEPLGIQDAKFFAAGLKRLCRESGIPLRDIEVILYVEDDEGSTLSIRQAGVPPLCRTQINLNGKNLGVFNGHEELS